MNAEIFLFCDPCLQGDFATPPLAHPGRLTA